MILVIARQTSGRVYIEKNTREHGNFSDVNYCTLYCPKNSDHGYNILRHLAVVLYSVVVETYMFYCCT